MNEPLAIVGMACRLPGADGLEAFWELISQGGVAWGPLPESRLARDLYFHPQKSRVGKSYSEMGAVVSDRPVDPAICPLTPDLLERFDVAHHIFLEVASQACRDAGMDPFAMPADRRTGVYVGHTGGSTRIGDIVYANGIDETAALLSEVGPALDALGAKAADVAAEMTAEVRRRYAARQPGRRLDLGAIGAAKIVQEALRLDGPYLVVDAACASSLQAMAIAARSLLQGGIDQAIVGGASYCKSDSLVLFSAAQSVSNSGSYPFGANADGLITAEGYVAIVIKTLSRAVADGDRIRAVIRGLGVASDGKGKSLWAPRQEGQVLAVERAYPDPTDIGRLEYIEAHATSTQVGDATELGALARLMSKHLPTGGKIPIGSVKANIGHTLETAGISSLVKVVLAMEHDLIPPGSTCREFNEEFDWQSGPFTVPLEPLAWPRHGDGSPRCAAVNAFGIGGLNVHVSLAEHVPGSAAARPRPAVDADAEAIAIVGAGCVLPGALSLDGFFARLESGECAIGPVPAERWAASRAVDPTQPRAWHATAGLGGFVRGFQYDWRRHKVPPKQIDAANPLQFMLLEAADAAIADAGGAQAGLDRTRTGVVVGTLFGGDFADQLQMGLRLPETGRYLRSALAARGVSAPDAERIVTAYEKKVLERMPALVDETGSFTSSTLASRLTKTFDLMGGALALDSGDCSSVSALAAAVDMLREGACDAMICAAGERSMDLMAYEGRSLAGTLSDRPISVLDGRDQGGDVPGEGAVVLVLKRLADARAAGNRIRGVIRGVALGSAGDATTALKRVIRESCAQAMLRADAVQAVEVAVAGGSDRADEYLSTLGKHYAHSPAGGPPPVAGALDGLIGHTGAVAGAAGILKLSRGLTTASLPGTAALEVPRRDVHGMAAAASALPIGSGGDGAWRAGSVTVVQDRQAGHVVIDNGLDVPAAARAGDPQRRSAQARPAAAAAVPAGRPLVAAIFPGQGSQYTDMFRTLCSESAEARRVADRLDAFARETGLETLAEIAWRPDNGLGTRIWDTQWAMYLGDLLAWGVLQDMGFAPDVVASHSFGEFPALAAVGAWTPQDGARATRARAEAVEAHGPRHGAMLSVIADHDAVAAALEPFAGQVWVCAENAPQQYVVGGSARVVDAVEVIIESRRLKSKRLAVPSPFHTPLLAAAAEQLGTVLRTLPISAPNLPLYSSTTVERLDGPDAVRGSLIRQMTETVHWIGVVEKLYAAGVRTFVEVGPSGVLVGLARRILEGRSDVTFLQFDQRARPAGEHLARLREQLAAAGALRTAAAETRAVVDVRTTVQAGRTVAFDATARRRERNRAGGSGRTPSRPVVTRPAAEMPTRQVPAALLDRGRSMPDAAPPALPTESGSRSGGRLTGAGPGTQVVEAVATARPSAAAAAAARLQLAEASHLEDAVAALLTEARVSLPLASAGADSSGVRMFLDSVDHLFEVAAAHHDVILAAPTLDGLCDVLARMGGKAAWLPRRPASVTTGTSATRTELESVLIDFVVEQTGYPREIVELDADLEADLGIDSIRKAQLFGEIGQKYGLTADESVSLDAFPTLRHLLDYMLPRVGGPAGAPAADATTAAAPANGHAGQGHANNGHATNGHAGNGHAQNSHALPGQAAPAQPASGRDGELRLELEQVLVDFVVEQTGYPREIVELDADLEADLGIDSIRKAQLFGEIGQKYGLTADESVSLDEFPTLRHLLDYMLPRVGGTEDGQRAGAAAAAAPTNGHAGNGHAGHDHATNGHAGNGHVGNGHVKNGPATQSPLATAAPSSGRGGEVRAELEQVLIDFVVEQTGYPREIVELDADLEADLGIDSIRKAQLFGEIGQKYGLTADESVSLDAFPTLRHLLDYMLPRVGGPAGAPAADATTAAAPANGHAGQGDAGSPSFDRGLQNGRRHAEAMRSWARQGVAAASSSLGIPARIGDEEIVAELAGAAAGAGLDESVLHAAFVDPTVALGTCDALIVAPTATGKARGMVVCFGRHAEPDVRHVREGGVTATLVGVKGLPGAVCGWNDAGLIVFVGRDAPRGADSARIACERIVAGCRSIAEAEALLQRSSRAPEGLVVADVRGGVFVAQSSGVIVATGESFESFEQRSPLVRVALADGETPADAALAAIVQGGVNPLPAALSSACTWLAVGVADGKAAVRSGSPRGTWLAADDVTARGIWQTVAAQGGASSAPGQPQAEITRRYALTVQDLGTTRQTRSLRAQRVLILGSGEVAEALAAAIVARGGTPVVVGAASLPAALAAVEQAEQAGPVRHFVVVGPRQTDAWLPTRATHLEVPFFALQRWLTARGKAGDTASATLTAITDLGGDFGVTAAVGAVEGGALSGLCKGIAREYSGLHVRCVDAAPTLAVGRLADAVIAEMEDGTGPVEIGLVAGRRVTVVPCARPPLAGARLAALERGSVWVVTGGARGVTAACARELGRRYGLRLVLLGSTEPVDVDPEWLRLDEAGSRDLKGRVMLEARGRGEDPRTAWRAVEKSIEIARSLAAFRTAGVVASYEACDLADATGVRAVCARIAREVGPVRGIVHGAGYEAACRFEKKTAAGLEATLGPKCVGLENLLAALDARSLEALVGFGSTSGRLGGHGQADYSLANDMLAKMIGRLRRQLRATVFHWHAWDEVGMASRPESRFVLEQFGLRFMPLAEGVRRFMDEIEAGLPDAEVLVTEPAMCPDAVTEAAQAAVQAAVQVRHAAGSLVQGVERRADGTEVCFRLDPTADRFLVEHTQYGRPLLPAVMAAEILAQAALAAGVCDRVAELHDFTVERPIGFADDEPREVLVQVSGTPDGAKLRGLVRLASGESRVHVRGSVPGTAADPITARLDEPPFPFNPMVYQDDAPLRHGPAFRTLVGLFLDRSGGWARLTAPDPDAIAAPRGAMGWTVPVALLDGCIVACAVYSYVLCGRRVEIPVRFERLRLAHPPLSGEKCTARLFFRAQDARESVYDLVLFRGDGRAILALDGLHLAVMGPDRSRST